MRTIIVILGCAVALTSCKKPDEAKSEAKPEPKPTEAPASACTPEHTKIEELGFCVKVPKTWERQPDANDGSKGVRWFRVGEGGVFLISVDPEIKTLPDFNGSSPNLTNVTKGEFDAGKGKWRYSHDDKSGLAEVEVAGPKGLIMWASSGGDLKSLETELELAKTIVPL